MAGNGKLMEQAAYIFLEWRRYLQRDYLRAGTTIQQIALLRQLKKQGCMLPANIADFLHCDRPTASTVIGNLEKKGLIARCRDEGDARRRRVTLTDEGASYIAQVESRCTKVTVNPFDVLSEQEKQVLHSLLQRCCRRVDEIRKERTIMNETIKTLHALHSTHGNFTSAPVPEEALKTVLQACVRGANAQNRQSYSIVVVRGEEKVLKTIGSGVKAPVALVFLADYNRIYDVGDHLGYPSDYDSLFYYLTAHTDAVIAAQTAVIAAASLGLATLFTNSIHNALRKDLEELYTELDLPQERCFPVTAVLLGYEDKAPAHKRGRLCGAGVVHEGRYTRLKEPQLDEIVRQIEDPEAGFGGKGYLETYYTKIRAPQPAEVTQKMDSMLLKRLQPMITPQK